MDYKAILQSIQQLLSSPKGKLFGKTFRFLFLFGIVGLLLYQLSQIGFKELWDAMPRNIWFYLIFLVMYFALPLTEQFIYRMSLDFDFWTGFKVFIKKKVLNQELIGYSGEAYFFVWAKDNLKESPKRIFQVLKDNTIISALASTLAALFLLSLFSYFVNVNLFQGQFLDSTTMVAGAGILVILVVLIFTFRKSIISVDRATAFKMFMVHEIRIFIVYSLEIIQWMIVIPTIPMYVWFTFLSVKIISTRIPFLPNQDLVFVSASLGIAQYVDISEAEIGGILLCSNALMKFLNLIFFLLFFNDRKKAEPKENGK